jgi:hypothetical protein
VHGSLNTERVTALLFHNRQQNGGRRTVNGASALKLLPCIRGSPDVRDLPGCTLRRISVQACANRR